MVGSSRACRRSYAEVNDSDVVSRCLKVMVEECKTWWCHDVMLRCDKVECLKKLESLNKA